MRTPDTCPELRKKEVEQFGDYQDPEHIYYPFVPPAEAIQQIQGRVEELERANKHAYPWR